MRAAGLEGRCKKRWRKTTVADPEAEAARDLIQRRFGPSEEIDRRYVGDITYIATWEGWAYDLRWTLTVDEPIPSDELLGHIRKRINELINRDLRLSFGQ